MSPSDEVSTHEKGWVQSPNRRGTDDILWSCFLAVFVCTWTVLHLNLPAQNESYWRSMQRKLRWMTMAIVVPEVVTASAFAQRVAARNALKSIKGIPGCEWTLSHTFYLNMGGIWIEPKNGQSFPVNATVFQYLVEKGVITSPNLTKKDIWDRSKADKFAKIFACLQIFWLAIQSAGRGAQKLPVTPLEIATLGFMIPSLATFVLWFAKPVDIEVPTRLKLESTLDELLKMCLKDRASLPYNWRDTPLDFIQPVNSPSFVSEFILKVNAWPGRHKFFGSANRIRNDVFALKYSKLDQLVVLSVWIGYAGIHFSAWNFSFPTRTELLLWRISCLIMTGSMFVFWVTSNRKFYWIFAFLMPSKEKREKAMQVAFEKHRVSGVQLVTGVFGTVAYMFARLTLISLAFSSLRSMPKEVFQTVQWTNYLPHAS